MNITLCTTGWRNNFFRATRAAGHCLASAGLILFCCFFSIPGVAHSAGPLDVITTAQKGIDQADTDLFFQAFDVDSVISKAGPTLFQALKEQVASGALRSKNPAVDFLLAGVLDADEGQQILLMQMLKSELRSFVASGISGGYFAGKPNGKVKIDSLSLTSLLDKISPGRKEFIPGKILSQTDSAATISAQFHDAEAGTFPLKLALEKKGKLWKVVEVTNAAQLLKEATKRAR